LDCETPTSTSLISGLIFAFFFSVIGTKEKFIENNFSETSFDTNSIYHLHTMEILAIHLQFIYQSNGKTYTSQDYLKCEIM
jgi:hypothetical protein